MTSDTPTTEHEWTFIGQRLDRKGKAAFAWLDATGEERWYSKAVAPSACAARLARPPAPPEQAPVCATCGLSWVTRDADDTHCPECATIVGSAADAVTDATP